MTTRQTITILMVALLATWLTSPVASASGRGRRAAYMRSSSSATARTNQPVTSQQSRYRTPLPPSYYYYPQYTGAFHARYFDEIPSIYGTRPMRGTAW